MDQSEERVNAKDAEYAEIIENAIKESENTHRAKSDHQEGA